MKLGADNRKKTLLAAGLFIVALLLLFRTFIGGGTQASAARPITPAGSQVTQALESKAATPARPTVPRRTARRGRQPAAEQPNITASLDPRLRLDLLNAAERTTYEGSGRNIFRAEAEIPKPIAPAIVENKPEDALPPQPPPPPPIPLKFFGFASGPGEPKKVFLVQGDDIFVAKEGDIVNRRYKIVRIGSNSIEVEDVLNNNRQTLPLAG